ncbi:DJ-1/PfpI family protein [Blastopirellula sp. JC732]|uniref:DJ-1/PfpI family protein n=1 Tax=Blastopirellula sediminis TaxID=2894196 RepID=A0A9X1SJE0_9BACT|nr:DJ-1/PfpI family protein [Blastopirellula sediminis]MCC9604860.1 DJ-1/PfpI family protein [Blastopirellula sediminis]MCC9631841.1 DJ-1/PfpI family protein [Blastopirellula sediminis]
MSSSTIEIVPPKQRIAIAAILFPNMDQIDLTGPFSVLARLPNSSFQTLWKRNEPIRDHLGLGLLPDATFDEVGPIDLLLVPGGPGQEELMEDEEVLKFLRKRATKAKCVFSVCTGSIVCGAAGLLKGRAATTHWTALPLLKYFGAQPSKQRVVVDGKYVSAAGLTSGIDGALQVAALLRGEEVAQAIQLAIQYAPDPPFDCGEPNQAPPVILSRVTQQTAELTARRAATAKRIGAKLGVRFPEEKAKEELIAFIRAAFAGVTLGDGVGLLQGQGLDDYASAEELAKIREQDEKLDWSRIPPDLLNCCESSLSFFDGAGMRFHLPAFLVADLEGTFHQDIQVRVIGGSAESFGLLTSLQREAVRRYLKFLYKRFSHQEENLEALAGYWNEANDPAD